MQRIIIRLSVALVTFLAGITTTHLPGVSRPGTPRATISNAQAEQEVLAVEREYIRAHTERDVAALDRILADEFVIGPMMGRVRTKEARLALVANPDFTFDAIETDDVRVRASGDEATVSGRARVSGRYGDREFTSPVYGFIRSYERREGRWQIRYVQIIPAAQ